MQSGAKVGAVSKKQRIEFFVEPMEIVDSVGGRTRMKIRDAISEGSLWINLHKGS